MLSMELNEQMTRVGPGTPMGNLLRRYWHPIAAAAELEESPTKSVRLLGEDLTLYKDRGGNIGLLESACAHRRVNLLYGIPEERGLRCPYHGWLYDETGQCLEMPAEAPDSTFPERVKLQAYPVQQLAGLIFAYMGPAPAPLLPRWDVLVRENVERDIGLSMVPCNWLQIMENSMDPVHAEWLHNYYTNFVLQRLGALEDAENFWRGRANIRRHVKTGFDVFEYGIIKRRVLEGDDEENPRWRIGHPVLFPNILRSATGNTLQIRVPVDDTHTLYVYFNAYGMPDGEAAPAVPDEEVPYYTVPLPGTDERGRPVWNLLDHNAGQDNVAWMSQGSISQRWRETLGESDKGLILFRRLLHEQMRIVEDGGEPMNVMRDPAKNLSIVTPYEAMEGADPYGGGGRPRRRAGAIQTGNAGKYSPINRKRAVAAGFPVADVPESAPHPTGAGTQVL